MRRPVRRLAQLTSSGTAFVLLALTLSGCFQPVGAAIPPTAVTPDGAPPMTVAALDTPTVDPVAEAMATANMETAIAMNMFNLTADAMNTQAAETATMQAILFPSATFTPDVAIPPTIDFTFPGTPTPTETPTEAPTATFTPIATNTLTIEEQQATLFAESTRVFGDLTATAFALGTYAPTLTPTETPTSTLEALSIPTLDPDAQATINALSGGGGLNGAPPTSTLSFPTAVAFQETSVFPPQDPLQETLDAQATQIIATVTADAAFNLTSTAQAILGFQTPIIPPPIDTFPTPTFPPAIFVGPGTPTYPPGTPGIPGSRAGGPIDAGCRYTVIGGDTLYSIALRFQPYGSSLSRIISANGIVNPSLIRPGRVLYIPSCGLPEVGVPPVTVVPPGTGSGRVYVVQEGDTLWRISRMFGVRVMAIAQLNGIQNINLIYIGQLITIP